MNGLLEALAGYKLKGSDLSGVKIDWCKDSDHLDDKLGIILNLLLVIHIYITI